MILTQQKIAVALLSVSTVMVQHGICAMAAACDGYDEPRVKIMMENGVSQEDAEFMLKMDLSQLIELDLDGPLVFVENDM